MLTCFKGFIRRRPRGKLDRSLVRKNLLRHKSRASTPPEPSPRNVPRWAAKLLARRRLRRRRANKKQHDDFPPTEGIWREEVTVRFSEEELCSLSFGSCEGDERRLASQAPPLPPLEDEPFASSTPPLPPLVEQYPGAMSPKEECRPLQADPSPPRYNVAAEGILLDLSYYQTENTACTTESPWGDVSKWTETLCGSSSSSSNQSTMSTWKTKEQPLGRRFRRVQFLLDQDETRLIPSHRDYSVQEKLSIWTDTQTINWCARRNSKEWRYEGKNWEKVLEEDKFLSDSHGNLIHPVHWEANHV